MKVKLQKSVTGEEEMRVECVETFCRSYDDIRMCIDQADRNRTVKGHALNASSSRAHTIYTVRYERLRREMNPATKKEQVRACVFLLLVRMIEGGVWSGGSRM